MDNQKSNEGSGRDLGREGAGSSMGKESTTGRTGGAGTSGTSGTSGSSAAGSSGSIGGAGPDISKSTNEMHKTIDKAAEAAQPVVDRLASSAHAGVDKVSGALSGASRSMDEKSRQLSEAYKHFADTGREYVRGSPATSLLVAVGAGFILSKLLSGRR